MKRASRSQLSTCSWSDKMARARRASCAARATASSTLMSSMLAILATEERATPRPGAAPRARPRPTVLSRSAAVGIAAALGAASGAPGVPCMGFSVNEVGVAAAAAPWRVLPRMVGVPRPPLAACRPEGLAPMPAQHPHERWQQSTQRVARALQNAVQYARPRSMQPQCVRLKSWTRWMRCVSMPTTDSFHLSVVWSSSWTTS